MTGDCSEGGQRVCGVEFSALSVQETAARVIAWLAEPGPGRYFACVNPHSIMVARRDGAFARALEECDLNTADGIGVLLASRLLGGRIRERVCGPDLFAAVCARLNQKCPGTRVFFLGATPETLRALTERFAREFPQLVIAGSFAPPFRQEFTDEDDNAMVAAVNASGAQVLWIGLGAPKQEKLAHRIRHRLNVRVIGPVGGVFDFYTGRVKLPPRWMQHAGLIWLYRWAQQPRRLLRRNLDSPLFLGCVLVQRITKGRLVS